ncbi:MAG: hypothetical protein QM764_12830 [Chitinophagaceae bacterium]
MESTNFNTSRLLWIIAATGICAGLVAFNQKEQKPQQQKLKPAQTDTIPKKKELKIRNLDEALEDENDVNVNIDLQKLNVELSKIGPEVQKALANVNVEIKNIDVAAINKEINTALAQVDGEKINKQIKVALDAVNWNEIKQEIAKVKEINLDELHVSLDKMNVELQKIKPELEKNLAPLHIQVEKLKVELKEYKQFVNGLNEDGLINKEGEYHIQQKDGELIINGKVQPKNVYDKYRSFLEKHKNLNIEKSDDNFNINED